MKKIVLFIVIFAFATSVALAQSGTVGRGWTLPPKKTETIDTTIVKKKDKKTFSDDVYNTGKKTGGSEQGNREENTNPQQITVLCNTCPPQPTVRYQDMTVINTVMATQQVVDMITYPTIYYDPYYHYRYRRAYSHRWVTIRL